MMNRIFLSITVFLFIFCSAFAAEQASDPNQVAPRMGGNWTCIDYVESIDDFKPDSDIVSDALFVKGLQLNNEGTAIWVLSNNCSFTTEWDDRQVTSIPGQPAASYLKTMNGQTFLFVEWICDDITILHQPPCYYVFVKQAGQEAVSEPVGRWMVVDFVKTIEQFDPKHRSMTFEPVLRGLAFLKNGTVWWIYENNNRQQMEWSGDAVDYEPDYPAHFTIKRIDDKEYLFIEWISGDVTIRGEKPAYYVLKKAGQ